MEKAEQSRMRVPESRSEAITDRLFGVAVSDPYRWLEDTKAEEVQRWMAVQDRFAREWLSALPGRAALAARLKSLYYAESISTPLHRGNRCFYRRTHADKEKAVYYYREGREGKDRVLLDPNQMSADGSVSVGGIFPSHDGKKVAYTLRTNNSDEATLHILNVDTGVESEIDRIDGAKYAEPSFTPSGDGFFYTYLPPISEKLTVADRPGHAEIRFHKLGTDPETDRRVYERTGDPQTFLAVDLSRDGRWLFVQIQHGWNANDVYYRDLRHKGSTFKPLVVGEKALFSVEAFEDRFYVHTNLGAPRFRVVRVDPRHLGRDDWKEIVPESDGATLERAQLLGRHLVLTWLKNAANELEVRTLDGAPLRKVVLPGIGTSSGMAGLPDDDEAYFSFTSFTQPLQIFRTALASGATERWAEVKLPIDPFPYKVEQILYPSKDGTRISMFVVHRKDLKLDGSTPFLLTGYGGFNVNRLPEFSASLFPWLEAGGGYALPNLRGGGEYGEEWHKAGMLEKKQNVFDDFIAAAEYLVKAGFTRPERLAVLGRSNGGLLVGAALTQRPDLFRAVVCGVPLLDMVRYHLFGSGKTWIPEYGSAEDEISFRTLFAYSPYHHVKRGTKYPAILMLSADSDDRVDPMHARKMTALLQAATTSDLPVLLRIERHAGHGGADLVKQTVEQSADTYSFLMKELGMTPMFETLR
jgi:prolyl oligopeptidase